MFDEKGQESAPFELLVAVVIMTFVIVVGFRALDTLNEETCKGLLDKNIGEIKRAVETVVKTKSKVTVSFRLPPCFREDESELIIIDRRERQICSNICGGSISQCTLLQFSAPSYTKIECLRISSATDFPGPESGSESCDAYALGEPGEFEVAGWKSDEGIEIGDYTLIRQSNLFSRSPQVCVYMRT